jgi:hypothetical protein
MSIKLEDIAPPRRRLDVEHLKPSIKKLIDRRPGTRIALLVDLAKQPRPSLLRLPLRGRPRLDDLNEIVPLTRDRVTSGEHPHPERAARKHVDGAALSPARACCSCHDRAP